MNLDTLKAHLDHVLAGAPALDLQARLAVAVSGLPRRVRVPAHQCVATTTIAVTSVLRVASGRSTFQPKLISWS